MWKANYDLTPITAYFGSMVRSDEAEAIGSRTAFDDEFLRKILSIIPSLSTFGSSSICFGFSFIGGRLFGGFPLAELLLIKSGVGQCGAKLLNVRVIKPYLECQFSHYYFHSDRLDPEGLFGLDSAVSLWYPHGLECHQLAVWPRPQ